MKQHILVVDDSMIVRMDLRGALTAAGFEVTACDTMRSAEELLDKRSFSALVLDVMLPDGDGVQILQRVRADARHGETPVIMLSAEAEVRDRIRGLAMGADEYVGKPYNITYFISRVRELCRARRPSNFATTSVIGCRRILAVDDSRTFLEYVAQMLREDGHDVVLAASGKEALTMLAVQTIDCVLLDLHMPDIDGLETARRIRRTPGCESTPIIMLTESHEPLVEQEALDAGVDAFMHKSATLGVIHAKVRNLLRSRGASMGVQDAPVVPNPSTERRTKTNDTFRHTGPASQAPPFMSGRTSSTHRDRSVAKANNPLFVEAASAMGLNAQLALETLAKTLGRLHVDPQRMSHADLARALPALRDALRMFFSPAELAPRLEALNTIVVRARGRTD